MFRFTLVITSCLAVFVTAVRVEGAPGCNCRDGHRVHCPQCNTCCTLKVEREKEKKSCWKVECKDICVPCIVFPWQKRHHASACGGCDSCTSGCGPCSRVNNGAWVKTVRTLKKDSYECPTCKYTWTPTACCGDPCSAGCAAGCDGAGELAPPAAPQAEGPAVRTLRDEYDMPLPPAFSKDTQTAKTPVTATGLRLPQSMQRKTTR